MGNLRRVPAFTGITHLCLSVRDLDASLAFYSDVLGLPVLMEPFEGEAFEGREAMVLVGTTGLGLQKHERNDRSEFDPQRTGLDHIAFKVDSHDELEEWGRFLDKAGVPRSPIKPCGSFGQMIELRDPDNVQLEIQHL